MSYQIVTNFTGQIGVNPRVVRVITEDSFSVVTTAGYITNGPIQQLLPTDIVLVRYSDGVGFFSPLFNAGVITLSPLSSLPIPINSVGTTQLQDGAVTAVKIASNAVTTAKILAANVTLAKLAPGITPSHIVFAAGSHTTTGGSPAETFTVTGALNTDIVFVNLKTPGITPVTVLHSEAGSGNISVTFSADPSTDTIVSYQVLRAAS